MMLPSVSCYFQRCQVECRVLPSSLPGGFRIVPSSLTSGWSTRIARRMPTAKVAQETSCEQPAKRVSKKLVILARTEEIR